MRICGLELKIVGYILDLSTDSFAVLVLTCAIVAVCAVARGNDNK